MERLLQAHRRAGTGRSSKETSYWPNYYFPVLTISVKSIFSSVSAFLEAGL